MPRPKKNASGQPLNNEDNKLLTESENAQQNASKMAETKEEQMMSPIEVEEWAAQPIASADMMSFLIVAPNDIEVKQGRMYIATGIIIKDGYKGLIFPTPHNAINGLQAETDYHLTRSDIISMQAQKKVKLALNIEDDTVIQEHTNFGSRSRNIIIPKGTPLAELVLFKL